MAVSRRGAAPGGALGPTVPPCSSATPTPGRPGLDEAPTCRVGFNAREGGWIDGLERAGWRDGFRHLRGEARAYTWYSPNAGNGFRLDQAFVNGDLLPTLGSVRYEWGRRRPGVRPTPALSDHAALLLDFTAGSRAYNDSGSAMIEIRLPAPRRRHRLHRARRRP